MATRVEMIIETLRDNPGRTFTARELAVEFVKRYPMEINEKSNNPNYDTEEKLLAQLAAEVAGQRTRRAKQVCPNVGTIDEPRPRIYFWDENPDVRSSSNSGRLALETDEGDVDQPLIPLKQGKLSEKDLYPLLAKFLSEEYGLYCARIDEKTSKNSKGKGGNHWLHPDIVSLEPLDKAWSGSVRTCVREGNHKSVKIWSFEVKLNLTSSNVRESFFQAVSNSTWANYGYLVATSISSGVEKELQMLSALHGIGVLVFNAQEIFESQILIPARENTEVNWESANRIVEENSDFERFIEQVAIYFQTGKLIKEVWNR